MAATASITRRLKSVQNMVQSAYPIAASTKIYAGTAVGDNASGYARALVAGDHFFGLAGEEMDNSSGSAGDLNILCQHGMMVELDVTGAAITTVGSKVYASADNTFTTTAGSNSLIGYIREWISGTKCMVELHPYRA